MREKCVVLMQHVKLRQIQLKNHPSLNERWVQDVIAEDPSILGIGDVVLKDKERVHRNAGRLDLLLLMRWLMTNFQKTVWTVLFSI